MFGKTYKWKILTNSLIFIKNTDEVIFNYSPSELECEMKLKTSHREIKAHKT